MLRPGMRPMEGKLQKILSWKSRATLQIGDDLSDNYVGLLFREKRKKLNERN